MNNQNKHKSQSSQNTDSKEPKPNKNNREQKPTYFERVILGKGTVSEPWPTSDELWRDHKVSKAIKAHNNLVEERKKS